MALLTAALAPPAPAQTIYTWANTATDFNADGSWTTAGVPGATDRAVFNASAGIVQPQLTTSATVSQVAFGLSGTTSGYVLGATTGAVTLQLNSTSTTGTSAAIHSNGNNTIAANLVLGGGNQRFTTGTGAGTASGAGLRLTGTISGGSASNTLTFTGAGTARVIGLDGTANTFASVPVMGANVVVEAARLGDASNGGASSLGTSTTLQMAAGQLTYTGAGETTNRSFELVSGTSTISSGSTSGTLTVTGSISTSTAGAKRINLQPLGSSTIDIEGVVSDGAGTVSLLAGPSQNVVRLSNAGNSFSGGAIVRGATLETAIIGTSGASSPLGTSGTVQFGGGGAYSNRVISRLRYTGTGETTSKVMLNAGGASDILVNGAAAIEQAGTGLLDLTADIAYDVPNYQRNLRLEGSTSGTGRLSGRLTDNGTGVVGLDKRGTGTWILGGANTYSGTTAVRGGVLALGTNDALGSGAVLVNGGELALGGFTDSVGEVTLTSGAITGGAGGVLTSTVGFTVASGSVSAVLAGGVGLSKTTGGTVTLTGANTYSGATSVAEGTLRVNGSIAAGSLVDVLATGTLTGIGTIHGDATIAGAHAPGDVVGLQTFNGDLTYAAGSTVSWQLLANSNDGPAYSGQVAVPTGDLTFAGPTALSLGFADPGSTVDWSAPYWGSNRSWLVYDLAAGVTSGIGNLSITTEDWLDGFGGLLSAARPGAAFSINQVGQDVYLSYIAPVPVPEPTAGMLALAAIGGLAARRTLRRRRSAGG